MRGTDYVKSVLKDETCASADVVVGSATRRPGMLLPAVTASAAGATTTAATTTAVTAATATATTASTATAESTTATAAATTTASKAASTAATTATFSLGTCFVDRERTALQVFTVQSRNRRFGFRLRGHFHETETARLAAELVFQYVDLLYRTVLAECTAQILFGYIARQITHKDIHH
jgi:hypothetical protein